MALAIKAALSGLLASKREILVMGSSEDILSALKDSQSFFRTAMSALKISRYTLSKDKDKLIYKRADHGDYPSLDVFDQQCNDTDLEIFTGLRDKPPRPFRPPWHFLPPNPKIEPINALNKDHFINDVPKFKEKFAETELSVFGKTPQEIGESLFQTYEEALQDISYRIDFREEEFSGEVKELTDRHPRFIFLKLSYLLGLIHSKKEIQLICQNETIDFRSFGTFRKTNSGLPLKNGQKQNNFNMLGHFISCLYRSGYLCTKSQNIIGGEKTRTVFCFKPDPDKKIELEPLSSILNSTNINVAFLKNYLS